MNLYFCRHSVTGLAIISPLFCPCSWMTASGRPWGKSSTMNRHPKPKNMSNPTFLSNGCSRVTLRGQVGAPGMVHVKKDPVPLGPVQAYNFITVQLIRGDAGINTAQAMKHDRVSGPAPELGKVLDLAACSVHRYGIVPGAERATAARQLVAVESVQVFSKQDLFKRVVLQGSRIVLSSAVLRVRELTVFLNMLNMLVFLYWLRVALFRCRTFSARWFVCGAPLPRVLPNLRSGIAQGYLISGLSARPVPDPARDSGTCCCRLRRRL